MTPKQQDLSQSLSESGRNRGSGSPYMGWELNSSAKMMTQEDLGQGSVEDVGDTEMMPRCDVTSGTPRPCCLTSPASMSSRAVRCRRKLFSGKDVSALGMQLWLPAGNTISLLNAYVAPGTTSHLSPSKAGLVIPQLGKVPGDTESSTHPIPSHPTDGKHKPPSPEGKVSQDISHPATAFVPSPCVTYSSSAARRALIPRS